MSQHVSTIRTWLSALRGEDGQGLSEYALILGLVAIVAVAALQLLGVSITSFLDSVATSL
jgi:Flp pilus assembly pilin Flp